MADILMGGLRDRQRILEELGDKVLAALASAVRATLQDYAEYRNRYPDWVAQSSARGLANWIHDRLWHHASGQMIVIDGVFVYERSGTRELIVDDRYRIRVKRHRAGAAVSTYPTQTALDFMEQPDGQRVLQGLEQIRLIFGYEWNHESNDIGAAVLSLRDGHRNVLWVEELHDAPGPELGLPAREAPDRPDLQLPQTGTSDQQRRSAGS